MIFERRWISTFKKIIGLLRVWGRGWGKDWGETKKWGERFRQRGQQTSCNYLIRWSESELRAAVAVRHIRSHLLKLCRPWCCTRASWGWGAWGRARLGMGWCGGWGEGGGIGRCWGRGERGRGLNRGPLLHDWWWEGWLNRRADWLGKLLKLWSDWLPVFNYRHTYLPVHISCVLRGWAAVGNSGALPWPWK